jgi:hypothetical protein
MGDHALTLASGITPENAHLYMDDVDGFMVATGINLDGDFYNIDGKKLARLSNSPANTEPDHEPQQGTPRRPLVPQPHGAQHQGPEIRMAGPDLDLHQRRGLP